MVLLGLVFHVGGWRKINTCLSLKRRSSGVFQQIIRLQTAVVGLSAITQFLSGWKCLYAFLKERAASSFVLCLLFHLYFWLEWKPNRWKPAFCCLCPHELIHLQCCAQGLKDFKNAKRTIFGDKNDGAINMCKAQFCCVIGVKVQQRCCTFT